MNISKESYRNKVRGCWMGKNIGGTLGAPFEGIRISEDIEFYTEDLSKGAIPNDDLDLQLAFLNAAERFGKAVDAKILAEYWVTAITPNWAEYGVGKTNLRLGLQPPVSGGFVNHYKDSNGAWIRSELWACLMPGHPELAVRYAYQDAIVDHADEGVYAEVFTAALESAAFAEPHGLQPTRFLHPWDLPGKSTRVGCHCLLRQSTLTTLNLSLISIC